jgi:hypothetical protein
MLDLGFQNDFENNPVQWGFWGWIKAESCNVKW